VELGELANEWRGFKFWSSRQTPTQPEYNWRPSEDGSELEWKPEYGYKKHPLLEEYVDCLHFILSIGLSEFTDLTFMNKHVSRNSPRESETALSQFNKLFEAIVDFTRFDTHEHYKDIFDLFFGLGLKLGFTWEQIEQAYMSKNEVNHARQQNGY
jgi:dimeric dUTPase (all-alpha-NTP-PPase superfamily)